MVGWSQAELRFRWIPATLLFVAFALVYARTACPTIFGGDSAELAAAAATFGVPHPPGYPLYTLVTGLLSRPVLWLGLAGDFGGATALLSGLYAAGAVALLFLLARRLGATVAGAAVAAVALGSGRTFWSQATVTEVYTFDLLLGLTAALAFVRAEERDTRRAALLAAALAGLWLGHRFVNLIYLPAVLALAAPASVVAHARRHWLPLLAGLALGGAGVFLYLPLASARDPAIDIGDPSTLERFWVVVKGTPYMRHMAEGGEQVPRFFAGIWRQLGPGAALAVVGWTTWRANRRALFGALWVTLCCLGFASGYRILDIDVYFVPAIAALALVAGFGADALAGLLARFGDAARAATGAALVALTAWGLAMNQASCDVSWNRLSRYAAEDLLASADENGLILVNGDSTIHGLWYLQAIEDARPDVLVLSLGHLWPWHLEQLRARFPDDPWPGESTDARALLDALSAVRPTYVSLSVDTTVLTGPGADGNGYGTITSGAAMRLLPAGSTMDARVLALANHELLTAAVARFGEIPREIDMDSKSTILQYALALSRNAALLDQLKEEGRAEESRRLLLTLDPDRHERDVAEDAWRGLGRRVPRLELGRRAREALAR